MQPKRIEGREQIRSERFVSMEHKFVRREGVRVRSVVAVPDAPHLRLSRYDRLASVGNGHVRTTRFQAHNVASGERNIDAKRLHGSVCVCRPGRDL